MRDLSRGHLVLFALFFLCLFAALFVGVVQVHRRNLTRHAAASYTAAPAPPLTN